ncbi:AMMECR1 domain-containing protein [Gammaproteobacteria bacterium 42_54_T18]|nr:AMMECR1 domain-containing protein [Gammaproteobacteria bacterium 42_54_T18]
MKESYQKLILETAKRSIKFGLTEQMALPIDPKEFEPALQELRASFVTLHLEGNLRGCIGTLEAYQPLIIDVAENAFNAAFKDPRFSALNVKEFPRLDYHISILTPPSNLAITSEADLLDQLRPNIDGIIIEEGMKRATFLPSVWEQLPDKKSFLTQLKLKAGFSPSYWSNNITIERYEVESFGS